MISGDWSSDVCSSDLAVPGLLEPFLAGKSSEPRISPGLPTPLYWTS